VTDPSTVSSALQEILPKIGHIFEHLVVKGISDIIMRVGDCLKKLTSTCVRHTGVEASVLGVYVLEDEGQSVLFVFEQHLCTYKTVN
jgi:hypothetical protein